MGVITIDNAEYEGALGDWEKARENFQNAIAGNKVELEYGDSANASLMEMVQTVNSLNDVLQLYKNLFEKDKENLMEIQETLTVLDENLAQTIRGNGKTIL